MTERRYPLADLVAMMRLPAERLDTATAANPFRSHRPTDNEARTMLEVGGSRWRTFHRDGLTADQAERYADRAGFHPSEIWPSWYDDELAELSVTCEECGGSFLPTRKGHRFCDPACQMRRAQREWKRRRYQTDPEFAERIRAQRRAYHDRKRRSVA